MTDGKYEADISVGMIDRKRYAESKAQEEAENAEVRYRFGCLNHQIC